MISRLSGRLVQCDVTEVVVDVQGVGYALAVPLSTHDRMPRLGEPVVLHTHLSVREDALVLYGFATPEERSLFRLLMTVTGVGPRLALNILSAMPAESFCAAIAAGDLKGLSRINGIGKRSAERLVVELRDRVGEIAPAAAIAGAAPEPSWSRDALDAVAALETLGFRTDAARKAVKKLCDEAAPTQPSAESLIRKALAVLNS